MKFKHYWLCFNCANKKGGVFPEGHVCTTILGKCLYCKKPNKTLVPYVDFDWPADKALTKTARMLRD